MPEPTIPTAAALATVAMSPGIVLFGANLGLQPTDLILGVAGAGVAMVLLKTVPSSGAGLLPFAKDTGLRVAFALSSALFAGVAAPVFGPIFYALLPASVQALVPLAKVLGLTAFVAGGGAQRLFNVIINWTARKGEPKPAEGGA